MEQSYAMGAREKIGIDSQNDTNFGILRHAIFLSILYIYSVNKRIERLHKIASSVNQKSSYDYFTICHTFVSQIKLFNDMRKRREINKANVS